MNNSSPGSVGTRVLAGIDIGGTNIGAVLTTDAGAVIAQRSEPTPVGGLHMAATAVRLVRDLLADHPTAPLGAVGVGAAGIIGAGGRIEAASDSFTDWAGFELGDYLTGELDVPVRVENDVNAFLLGELTWGAARGKEHALGVMLGTGVGGAIVVNGSIFGGAHGAAGEIGHIPGFSDILCTCGLRGHLETLASGRSIERLYAEVTGTTLAGPDVATASRAGDADAIRIFDEAAVALATSIVTTVTLFDLGDVVVGGGVTSAWDLLEPQLTATLAANPPVSGYGVNVRRGTLGDLAVALGAAAAAHLTTTPSSTTRRGAATAVAAV